MKWKVFVDGQAGTTGLKIHEHLAKRSDLEILQIPAEKRKDVEVRRQYLNEADLVFLCLPDQAAIEAAALVTNPKTRIIDASTAHRTIWTYGLPELSQKQRAEIREAQRVANPGCHATGFVAAAYPLVHGGILAPTAPLTSYSLTGYSGGGKSLIEKFETWDDAKARAPKPYALKLTHKHLPEMQKIVGLTQPPVFTPIVADYYEGMAVFLPIPSALLQKKYTAADVQKYLADYYAQEKFVQVMPLGAEADFENGQMDVEGCNGTNRLELFVFGHEEQVLVVSRLDNLGKGASGAAIQNMNIMLGVDEATGLQG